MFLVGTRCETDTFSDASTRCRPDQRVGQVSTLEELGFTMSKILAYLNDENGASAAEYALILAIVGTAIAGAAVLLGSAISNALGNAANCINSPATAC